MPKEKQAKCAGFRPPCCAGPRFAEMRLLIVEAHAGGRASAERTGTSNSAICRRLRAEVRPSWRRTGRRMGYGGGFATVLRVGGPMENPRWPGARRDPGLAERSGSAAGPMRHIRVSGKIWKRHRRYGVAGNIGRPTSKTNLNPGTRPRAAGEGRSGSRRPEPTQIRGLVRGPVAAR